MLGKVVPSIPRRSQPGASTGLSMRNAAAPGCAAREHAADRRSATPEEPETLQAGGDHGRPRPGTLDNWIPYRFNGGRAPDRWEYAHEALEDAPDGSGAGAAPLRLTLGHG